MFEHGEGVPEILQFRIEDIGSNIIAIESLKEAPSGAMYEALQEVDVKNFWVEEREYVYNLIDASIDDSLDRAKSLLYFATEAIKWVSEDDFKEYPHHDKKFEHQTSLEVYERISKGLNIFQTVAHNQVIEHYSIAELGLSLGEELQKAFSSYEASLSEGSELLFKKEVFVMRELAAVCSLSCLDALSNDFPKKAKEILGSRSIASSYIDQLAYFTEARTSSPLFDIYKNNLFADLVEKIKPEDDMAIEDAMWLYDYSEKESVKASALSKAVEVTKYHRTQAQSENDGWIKKVMNYFSEPAGSYAKYIEGVNAIKHNIEDNFTYILLEHPDHIEDVVSELYGPTSQEKIWAELGDKVIELCTSMDRSSYDDIKEMSTIQAAFRCLVKDKTIADNVDEEILHWVSYYPGQDI